MSDVHQAAGRLIDPDRLTALRDLGLTQQSDPGMERYAARVRDLLGVPVSLVSLVQADQQVFPGMCGLPDPWAQRRSTPLSHSFCQHVVTSGEPLIIEDARLDPLVADNLATSEIGVVAYAGVPLTDDQGLVLGSLCAIQSTPRVWTADEISLLLDMAQDCSNELRLRLARLDADRERSRRDAIDVQLQTSLLRSQRLLSIAEALNTCRTVEDVRQQLDGFRYAGTGLIHLELLLREAPGDPRITGFDDLLGTRNIVIVRDLDQPHEVLDDETRARYVGMGALSAGYLRLRGSAGPIGVVELLWDVHRELEPQEHAMAAALSAYTSQALERAILIEDRISVAHELQSAMLAPLPEGTGLDLAACYLPAHSEERIGGDWYDVFVAPDSDEHGDLSVLVSVGDVTGHDIAAATVMGQVRAMLRQVAWDAPTAGPAEHIAALEQACNEFGIPASGTAALARLTPVAGSSDWRMTWVNAGHPPPIAIGPDGSVRLLTDHDVMFGHPDLFDQPRRDHTTDLSAGTTVLLYTDGLIDAPSLDLEERTAQLAQLAAEHHARGAACVIDAIQTTFVGLDDDVVSLAIRIPPAQA